MLIEVHDECLVAERRYFSDESMKPLNTVPEEVTPALQWAGLMEADHHFSPPSATASRLQ